MHDLILWYREESAKEDTNPVLLAAQFHYKYIRIHPFDDGNGRTARILMNFILMQNGYPPVVIKTEDKENYYAALRQADAGVFQPFLDYIAQNLNHSLEIMIKGANGESVEEPDDLDKEIALLGEKLKGHGRKIEKKSLPLMTTIVETSVKPLLQFFTKKCNKLSSFYLYTGFSIETDPSSYRLSSSSSEKQKIECLGKDWFYLKKEDRVLRVRFQFKKLNRSNLIEFNFDSIIWVTFRELNYSFENRAKVKTKKLYGEQLTEAEINEIVNTEIRAHINAIEVEIKKQP